MNILRTREILEIISQLIFRLFLQAVARLIVRRISNAGLLRYVYRLRLSSDYGISRVTAPNDRLSSTIADMERTANVICPNSSGKERRAGRRSVAQFLLSTTSTCADGFSPFCRGRFRARARARVRHEFPDHVSAQNLVGFSTCHFSEVPAWWDL